MEERGVGSVGLVFEGKDLFFFEKGQLGVVGEEFFDLFAVFLGVDRAGGVNEACARLETGKSLFDDLALENDEFFDVAGLESPARIDAAAEDAGI